MLSFAIFVALVNLSFMVWSAFYNPIVLAWYLGITVGIYAVLFLIITLSSPGNTTIGRRWNKIRGYIVTPG